MLRFKSYIIQKTLIRLWQAPAFIVLLVSFSSSNSYAQLDQDEKKVSGIIATGGEVSIIQNVFSGGVNTGLLLNASFYYKLTTKWEMGLGGDLYFGNIMGSRALHANIRRNFPRSFLALKIGANQGVFAQPQVLDTRYRPRHFLALGYHVRFGNVIVSTEFLHKRFVAISFENENQISSDIDALGFRFGIGFEL